MATRFAAEGALEAGAQRQAYGWLAQQVQAQASLLSYIDVFWGFAMVAALHPGRAHAAALGRASWFAAGTLTEAPISGSQRISALLHSSSEEMAYGIETPKMIWRGNTLTGL